MNCVRTGGRELTTEVFRDELAMPAVLIGDAAHAVPEFYSATDINQALWDAIDLCSMIVKRYDDDQLFSTIAQDFYASKSVRWQKFPKEWARKWMDAHGLPHDYLNDRLYWVKLRRAVRIGGHGDQIGSNFDELPPWKQEAMLKYKEKEEASWEQIQKRIRDRYTVDKAFTPQPGVRSSEIVLRYLDSRSIPDHEDPVVVGDQEINAMPTVGHDPKTV